MSSQESVSETFSAGDCAICGDAGAALMVIATDSDMLFYACPACECAWREPPVPHVVDAISPSARFAPSGFRCATRADVCAAAKEHLIAAIHQPGSPASFDGVAGFEFARAVVSKPRFIRCEWQHTSPEEPVLLFSELNGDRIETRKVEIYADGRMGFAGPGLEHLGTMLAECAVPDVATINSDSEFRCRAATHAEFEDAWQAALRLSAVQQGVAADDCRPSLRSVWPSPQNADTLGSVTVTP